MWHRLAVWVSVALAVRAVLTPNTLVLVNTDMPCKYLVVYIWTCMYVHENLFIHNASSRRFLYELCLNTISSLFDLKYGIQSLTISTCVLTYKAGKHFWICKPLATWWQSHIIHVWNCFTTDKHPHIQQSWDIWDSWVSPRHYGVLKNISVVQQHLRDIPISTN